MHLHPFSCIQDLILLNTAKHYAKIVVQRMVSKAILFHQTVDNKYLDVILLLLLSKAEV